MKIFRTALLFCLVSLTHAQSSPDPMESFNFTFEDREFLSLFVGERIPFTITVVVMDSRFSAGLLRLESADQSIFKVDNVTQVDLNSDKIPFNFTTVIEGLFVGISDLEIYYSNTTEEDEELVGTHRIKVKNVDTLLNPMFTYMTLVWLILSYIMMGSNMEWKDVRQKLRRPWAILIGMACQFFLMPAFAYALTKAFQFEDTTALGLIMVGTCPGGWLSNIFSLLLDCDFILSLTMTFCSTILAMGMMPLNLWIYARPYTTGNEELETPFVDLFLQLLYLTIPVVLSMIIARYSSKYRKYCGKLLKPAATMCIIVGVSLGIPAQLHIYQSATIEEWAVAVLLPLIGCTAGFIIAKIICFDKIQAVTISLETGAQNSLLAMAMLQLLYPDPESDLVGRVAYLLALISLIEGIIVTVIYLLTRYVFCRERYAEKADIIDIDKDKSLDAKDDRKDDIEAGKAADMLQGDCEKRETESSQLQIINDKSPVDMVTTGTQTEPSYDDHADHAYTNTAYE